MPGAPQVRILTTPQELFAAAAEEVVRSANEAVAARGKFSIALSGGSTPKNLFNLLATNARTTLPWDRMYFFWGDERHVGPTDPDSNYRMADEAMLSKIPVASGNIFRIEAENPDATAVADSYEKTLRKFFQLDPDGIPQFDLILLGMGPDGHTASLFPGTDGLKEKSRLVIANWVEKLKTHPALFHASGTERGSLRGFRGERNRQGNCAENGAGGRCPGRAISGEAGASHEW